MEEYMSEEQAQHLREICNDCDPQMMRKMWKTLYYELNFPCENIRYPQCCHDIVEFLSSL